LKSTHNTGRVACDFCDEFSFGQQNAYASLYGPCANNRALLSDSLFRVVPTLGQLVEGHLLIVPSRHLTSMGDLMPDESDQLEAICDSVRWIQHEVYGQAIFFEHGIRGAGSGGCGIEHAHLHAVPVAGDGVLDILVRKFDGCAIHSLATIKETVKQESPYLFFEDSSAHRYVFSVTKIPSQYMRKLVADSIGKSDWDWRKCGQEPELITTLERLAPLFSPATIVTGE
jgi:diadenosine tetraphosphate (Ap4A) HIT family hydrolase